MTKLEWHKLRLAISLWQNQDDSIEGFKTHFPSLFKKIKNSGVFKENVNELMPQEKFISISFSPDDTILIVFRNVREHFNRNNINPN